MILRIQGRGFSNKGIPRESGDDPHEIAFIAGRKPVFPARAGMILCIWRYRYLALGIPRESGDDPAGARLARAVAQYSPRERG